MEDYAVRGAVCRRGMIEYNGGGVAIGTTMESIDSAKVIKPNHVNRNSCRISTRCGNCGTFKHKTIDCPPLETFSPTTKYPHKTRITGSNNTRKDVPSETQSLKNEVFSTKEDCKHCGSGYHRTADCIVAKTRKVVEASGITSRMNAGFSLENARKMKSATKLHKINNCLFKATSSSALNHLVSSVNKAPAKLRNCEVACSEDVNIRHRQLQNITKFKERDILGDKDHAIRNGTAFASIMTMIAPIESTEC